MWKLRRNTRLHYEKEFFVLIGSIADSQAKIAGSNAVGEVIETEGFIRAQMDKVFGPEIVSISYGSESAKNLVLKSGHV